MASHGWKFKNFRPPRPAPPAAHVREAVQTAHGVARDAYATRQRQRHNRSLDRDARLDRAIEATHGASALLRSLIGRATQDPEFDERYGTSLREASAALQKERHALRKMRRRSR